MRKFQKKNELDGTIELIEFNRNYSDSTKKAISVIEEYRTTSQIEPRLIHAHLLHSVPPKLINKISEYLSEQDKSVTALVSKTSQTLFQPDRLQKMTSKLLLLVARGEQNQAEKILRNHPGLLLERGDVLYSLRQFTNITVFEYALWSWGIRDMCNMMLNCLPYNDHGETIRKDLLTQYINLEQNGLNYELNGNMINEKHYVFSPLIYVLHTYFDNFDRWTQAERTVLWCNVVSLAQCYDSVVTQHYCNPDVSSYPAPRSLKRYLMLNNGVTGLKKTWFFDMDPTDSSGLGFAFGVYFRHKWLHWASDVCVVTEPPGTKCNSGRKQSALPCFDFLALIALCNASIKNCSQLKNRLGTSISPMLKALR